MIRLARAAFDSDRRRRGDRLRRESDRRHCDLNRRDDSDQLCDVCRVRRNRMALTQLWVRMAAADSVDTAGTEDRAVWRVRRKRWSWRVARVVTRMFQRASPLASRGSITFRNRRQQLILRAPHEEALSHVFESRFVHTRSTTRDAREPGKPARRIPTRARHIIRTVTRIRNRSRCASIRSRSTQPTSRRMRNGAVIGLLRAGVQHRSAFASVSAVPSVPPISAVRAISTVSTVSAELWMLCAGAMRMREMRKASGSAAT